MNIYEDLDAATVPCAPKSVAEPHPPLTVVRGGRAALELEELMSITEDFARFQAIAWRLERAANTRLHEVQAVAPGTAPAQPASVASAREALPEV